MTESAARKGPATVEVAADKLERLLLLVERQSQAIERLLARHEHAARRAANLAGPTTAEAEAIVARKHRKYGL